MNRFVWFVMGIFAGIVLAAATGVMVINLLIPWEEVCAVVGPAQRVAETGAKLLTDLQDWLTKAESFLETATPEETAEARTGLSGILDKAGGIASGATRAVADIVTAPLQGLIALSKAVLSEVQAAVDAARDVLSSVDEARCS